MVKDKGAFVITIQTSQG